VTAIDGTPVQSWPQMRWQLMDAVTDGGEARIEVDSGGAARTRTLHFDAGEISPDAPDPMAKAGISLATPQPKVGQVIAGEAGEAAGLREGDIILAAGDLARPDAAALVATIRQHPGKQLQLTVLRDGTEVSLRVTPAAETDADGKPVGRIGVMLTGDFPMVTVRYGLFESLRRGVARTADTVWYSLKMMGRMVVGDVSLRNVSGPVTIADYAGQTARIGVSAYIGFLALISVSIGVLNLLPIPMLDGGHLLYYLLEAIRGKPLPERWLENGQRIGLGLLAALMSLAFFNDFSRLFS